MLDRSEHSEWRSGTCFKLRERIDQINSTKSGKWYGAAWKDDRKTEWRDGKMTELATCNCSHVMPPGRSTVTVSSSAPEQSTTVDSTPTYQTMEIERAIRYMSECVERKRSRKMDGGNACQEWIPHMDRHQPLQRSAGRDHLTRAERSSDSVYLVRLDLTIKTVGGKTLSTSISWLNIQIKIYVHLTVNRLRGFMIEP